MAIEVSKAGITETSQKLLSYAAELSDIFDNLQQITESIGTNITGFSQIEQLVDMLKQINQKKDKIVSEVKEFGNYLTSNVITGYSEFENMLASILSSIEINSSFLTKLASLSLIKLENTTFDSGGVNTVNSSGIDIITYEGDKQKDSDDKTRSVVRYSKGIEKDGVTEVDVIERTRELETKMSTAEGNYYYWKDQYEKTGTADSYQKMLQFKGLYDEAAKEYKEYRSRNRVWK